MCCVLLTLSSESTKASQTVGLASAEQADIYLHISPKAFVVFVVVVVVRGMIMHTGTIFMYIERAAPTGMQNPQRSTHGCWMKMPLLCFCIKASTALLYRNQLWPLSVPALLDEKIMDPWLWCTRFYTEATVCSHRTHSSPLAVGIDPQDSHLNFKNGVLFAKIFYIFPSPSCTSLQLCTLKRILRDVICSPDPNSRAFYIVHDRVLGDEMLERIRSVKSLTDDAIEMKYMSAPSDL